ncbi:hypothetical protein ACNPM4_14810 [Microbacterium sp. AGC62]
MSRPPGDKPAPPQPDDDGYKSPAPPRPIGKYSRQRVERVGIPKTAPKVLLAWVRSNTTEEEAKLLISRLSESASPERESKTIFDLLQPKKRSRGTSNWVLMIVNRSQPREVLRIEHALEGEAIVTDIVSLTTSTEAKNVLRTGYRKPRRTK